MEKFKNAKSYLAAINAILNQEDITIKMDDYIRYAFKIEMPVMDCADEMRAACLDNNEY